VKIMPMFSPAGMSLGLNNLPGLGSTLAGQVSDDTDELRKKKMLEAQQRALLGVGGSAAASSLFGSPFGGIGGTGRLF
jgi:H+/Cl- antiporter ClcA